MHILITGSDGFIGKHLVRGAVADGHRVTALTRRDRRVRNPQQVRNVPCDLLVPEGWDKAFEDIRDVDAVVHLAAIMPDAADVMPQDFEIGNHQFTRFLYDRVSKDASKVVPFVYFSSIGVIGDVQQDIVDERYEGNAENLHPYFASKLAGEDAIRQLNNAHINAFIFRLTSPYGPLMVQKSVLPFFVNRARNGDDLSWHGSGTRTQDFIHVDDIVGICMKAIEKNRDGIEPHMFYLASGQKTQMKQLAGIIADQCGVSAEASGQDDPQEGKNWGIDNSALKDFFDLMEMTDLRDGVGRYIDAQDDHGLIWWGE
jgi:UDP-glucose 4-epimerase